MKRIMPFVGKLLFALFMVGVVVFLLSLSWSALSKIFPESFLNQVFGLVNFDIAALAWLLCFIYIARGHTQRALSLVMFGVSVIGTVALVGLEIAMSTGWVQYAEVVTPLSILLTVMLAGHVVASYVFHLSAPDVAAEIERQADKDAIYEQAQRDATAELDRLRPGLAQALAADMVAGVMRDLGMARPLVVDGRVLPDAPANAGGPSESVGLASVGGVGNDGGPGVGLYTDAEGKPTGERFDGVLYDQFKAQARGAGRHGVWYAEELAGVISPNGHSPQA